MGPGCGTGHPKEGVLGAVVGCRTTLQAALGRVQPLERPARGTGLQQPRLLGQQPVGVCLGKAFWGTGGWGDPQGQLKCSSGSGSGALPGGGGGARSCGEGEERERERERERSGANMLRLLVPLQIPPKHTGGSITEGLGQVLGSQHPCDVAYRPQAGGCQVRRALPAARAILPATWEGPAAQPGFPGSPSPFPVPPALTSQRCLRSRAGDQAGPGREAGRREGRRGR